MCHNIIGFDPFEIQSLPDRNSVPYTLVVVGGVPHRVFLLQVKIFICSLEVLGRGYKCKRAIQTPTVWLGGVQVP